MGSWCLEAAANISTGDGDEAHVPSIRDRLLIVPWAHMHEPNAILGRLYTSLVMELRSSLSTPLAEELEKQFFSISTLFSHLCGR